MGTIVVQTYGLVAAAAMMGMFAMSANASEAVLLHAAGSLRGAVSEISQAFEKSAGLKMQAKFGPSGLLPGGFVAQNAVRPGGFWRGRRHAAGFQQVRPDGIA